METGAVVCLGATGQGKSTLFEQLIFQLAKSNRKDKPTIICLDPHGLLVHNIALRSIPDGREEETDLIEVGDTDYPVSLPLFTSVSGRERDKKIETIFNTFKTVFHENWSATRMENAVWNITATLCCQPQPTLLDVSKLLKNHAFRTRALSKVTDPEVIDFWDSYDQMPQSEKSQLSSPIISRLSALYRSIPVRNILCQTSGIDMMKWTDSGRIILVSLAGTEIASAADLIGEIILARIKLALMSRLPPTREHRRVYLFIDESHRYKGTTLPDLLSEARKTDNSLLLATQHISKWSEQLRDSILGNINALLTFKPGIEDSRLLAPIFDPLTAKALLHMSQGELVAKLHVDESTTPSTLDIRTFKIDREPDEARLERIRERSRASFTRPRSEVEKDLYGIPTEPEAAPDDECYES